MYALDLVHYEKSNGLAYALMVWFWFTLLPLSILHAWSFGVPLFVIWSLRQSPMALRGSLSVVTDADATCEPLVVCELLQ
jgi:hypothetical protein